jgi:phosphotriesterase-related protein
VRAGFIKIAFEADVRRTPPYLLDAVAQCARDTGVGVEIHTEKGAGAEAIVGLFADRGLSAQQLVLCHMDKRPDFALHRDLCKQGVMLEYDTFFRPKYEPERHVWRLLEQLVEDGLDAPIVLATDLADATLWRRLGGGPGLAGFVQPIVPSLQSMAFDSETIGRLVGANIVGRLSRPVKTEKG